MAFNPFNVFRRNQKTLFAVLTVFIMIMFTLSFGQGDLFQSIPRWLGSKQRYGDVVAVVDGSKVYESELAAARTDRTLANQFMASALMKASQTLTTTLKDQQAAATAPAKTLADEVSNGYSMIQFGLMDPQQGQRFLGQGRQALAGAEPKLKAILDNPSSTRDDVDLATTARNLVSAANQLQNFAVNRGTYFLSPNGNNKDALEALLWLKKADQLGIKYKGDDVPGLVNRELYGKFSAADYKEAETALLKNKGGDYPPSRLQTAIANEFKIRAAQSVLIGAVNPKASFDAPQAVSAPSEGLSFFRDRSAGAQIGFVTVPVENFLSKVPGLPTDAEKQELFTKYRNDEPDPAKERPGLKEPRKLKIEWLEAKGDEPFYKAAAADGLAKGEAQARLASAVVAPLFAAGWSQVTAPAVAGLTDAALAKPYDDFKQQEKLQLDFNWYPFSPTNAKPVSATTIKPGNLVAAGGVAAASLAAFGSPYPAVAMFASRAWVEDRNARVRVFASLLAPPTATHGQLFAGYAAARAREPQPLPLAVVRAELVEKAKTALQYSLATDDLNKFAEELTKLGQNKDRAPARAYIEKFVKERGLKLGASTQFKDQYSVGDDPGLAPLKSKADRSAFGSDTLPQFGREFFTDIDPQIAANFQLLIQILQQGMEPRRVPVKSLYTPFAFPEPKFKFPGTPPISLRDGEAGYMAWRTDEQPAVAPKSVAEADAKIVAAWKRIRARELAKDAAEKLAKETAAFGTSPGTVTAKFLDLHEKFKNGFPTQEEKDRARYFLLADVCPLPLTPVFGGNLQQNQYEDFRLKPSRDIPHPTGQMVEELMKLRDQPPSSSAVQTDSGKNYFYVAMVQSRKELPAEEYYARVFAGREDLARIIGNAQRRDEVMKARETAVALLKAEFKVEKESEKLAEKGDAE